MLLDFVLGSFSLHMTISFGDMFKRKKKSIEHVVSADTHITYEEELDTSADTYDDTYIEAYNDYLSDLQKAIDTNADKFTKELQANADTNGLYDIPSDYKNELEEYSSDVEIIDDAYEIEQSEMLKRVRG